jgi:hypothetical protein
MEAVMMTANEVVANIAATADRMYAGQPAVDRLAFQVGMLESKIREYVYLLDSLQQEVQEVIQILED